ALLVVVASASATVSINEVESDDPGGGNDWIELYNDGGAPVDIGNYVLKDNNNGNVLTIPGGTMIAAGGFFVSDTQPAFGLGSADSARLFTPGAAVLLDSYSWTSHAAATYGRCPDGAGGVGALTWTISATKGTANTCPGASVAWPGDSAIQIADGV